MVQRFSRFSLDPANQCIWLPKSIEETCNGIGHFRFSYAGGTFGLRRVLRPVLTSSDLSSI
jgi:hypothetical protein